MSIQFSETDCYRLQLAIEAYQHKTGSEFIWDEFETLKNKVAAYKEEVSVDLP